MFECRICNWVFQKQLWTTLGFNARQFPQMFLGVFSVTYSTPYCSLKPIIFRPDWAQIIPCWETAVWVWPQPWLDPDCSLFSLPCFQFLFYDYCFLWLLLSLVDIFCFVSTTLLEVVAWFWEVSRLGSFKRELVSKIHSETERSVNLTIRLLWSDPEFPFQLDLLWSRIVYIG